MRLFDVQLALPRLPADEKGPVLSFLVAAYNDSHAAQLVEQQYPLAFKLTVKVEVRPRTESVVFRGQWFRADLKDPPFMPDAQMPHVGP